MQDYDVSCIYNVYYVYIYIATIYKTGLKITYISKMECPLIVRITYSVYDEVIMRMERNYFKKFARCFETGSTSEKPHFHYYAVCTSKVNLRQYIQNHIGKGNGFYSVKQCKEGLEQLPVEYLSYMLKQDDNPKFVGFTEEEIETIKNLASETEKRVKQCSKGNAGRLADIRMELIKNCQGKVPTTPKALVSAIVQIHLNKGWIISDFRIADYARTLLAETSTSFRSRLEDSIVERLTR